MTTQKDPGTVYQALTAVIAELPGIAKGQKAPQGYQYRGIEAITQQVQPLFAKHGVVIIPKATIIDVKPAPAMKEGWQDVYLTVDWTIVGPDGSTLEATTTGIGRDNSDKATNKAQTMAYKYLLLHVLCIADAKDDADAADYDKGRSDGKTPKPKPKPENVTDLLATKRAALGKVAADEKLEPAVAGRLIGEWFGEGKTTKDLESIQLDSALEGLRRYGSTLRECTALASELDLSDEELRLVAADVWAPDAVPVDLIQLSDKELTALRDELTNRKTEAK